MKINIIIKKKPKITAFYPLAIWNDVTKSWYYNIGNANTDWLDKSINPYWSDRIKELNYLIFENTNVIQVIFDQGTFYYLYNEEKTK